MFWLPEKGLSREPGYAGSDPRALKYDTSRAMTLKIPY